MRRGDLYRVAHPSRTDPKRFRVFVVVSRQVLCDTTEYSTVICAPVSSSRAGLGFPSLRRFWRPLLAAGAMALAVGFGGLGSVWIAVAAGVMVYLAALFLVGGLRLQRGALPELTV